MQGQFSFLSPDIRQVVVSVNPKAGARSAADRVAQLAQLLGQAGMEVAVLTSLEDAANQANRLFGERRLRTLIAVGGDGTVAELANRTAPGLPLTVFPAGNENLLARHFGLGPTPQECCRTVVHGAVVQCDAGRANDRIFLIMVGCGFDGDVVRRLHQARTGHVTRASYFKPILASIGHYDYPELRVYWSEECPADGGAVAQQGPVPPPGTIADGVRWLFACNLPCYGGGLRIAPDADGSDGLLDVCTFRRGGLWHGLRYAAAVLGGTHRRLSDFALRRAGRLRITSDSKAPYQLDGDFGGFLPLEIEVLPKRLTLVVPQVKAAN